MKERILNDFKRVSALFQLIDKTNIPLLDYDILETKFNQLSRDIARLI